MAERLEDLNLPNSVVTRIIKDSIPDNQNVIISKEARIALGKAASVFVLYVTSAATNVSRKTGGKTGGKTLYASDVIDAMSDLEFESFVEPLKEAFEGFKQNQKDKKDSTKKKSKPEGEGDPAVETVDLDEDE